MLVSLKKALGMSYIYQQWGPTLKISKESHHYQSCQIWRELFSLLEAISDYRHVRERLQNQLRVNFPVTWEPYDKTLPRNAYEKVHYDPVSDDLVMRVVNKPETSVLVNQYQYLADILHEQRALVAQVGKPLEKAKGTSSDITTSLLRILLTQWVRTCTRMDGSISEGRSGIQGQLRPENAHSSTQSKCSWIHMPCWVTVDYKVEQGVLQQRKYVCAPEGNQGISKSMV